VLHLVAAALWTGLAGFTSNAIVCKPGTASLRSSRPLLKMSRPTLKVTPVTFPPGLARLSTRPCPTGSVKEIATIGIVLVALRAATVAAVADVTMMSTFC
jgi:hypothetical protein